MSLLFVFAPAALVGGFVEWVVKQMTRPKAHRGGTIQWLA